MLEGPPGTGKTTIMRAVERFFAQAEGFEKFATIIRINANLVADLASKDTKTRTDARAALVKAGARAVPVLLSPDADGRYVFDPDRLRAAITASRVSRSWAM